MGDETFMRHGSRGRPVETAVSRTYATVGDRKANTEHGENAWTGRQRSGSTHHRYRSGSIVREHWHNNAHGGQQFGRPIGGIHADGTTWGEPPSGGWENSKVGTT